MITILDIAKRFAPEASLSGFCGGAVSGDPYLLASELGREFGIARAAAERLKAWNSHKPKVLFP